MKRIPGTSVVALAAKEEGAGRPLQAATILECLQGSRQLVNIAQIDRTLALQLKLLLDFCEDADFDRGHAVLARLDSILSNLSLATRCHTSILELPEFTDQNY